MKRRRKKNSKESSQSTRPDAEHRQTLVKCKPGEGRTPIPPSDGRMDDESTMEGYDTELQPPEAPDARDASEDRDSHKDIHEDIHKDKHCLPSVRDDDSKTTKKQKEAKHKQKAKVEQTFKTRKRGRPPKVRVPEKVDDARAINQVEADEDRSKSLGWNNQGEVGEGGEEGGGATSTSFGDWNLSRRQSNGESSMPSTKGCDLPQRPQGHTLSENFVQFQMKSSTFVQSTARDKENDMTRTDEIIGNVIEIVCGPNRGLMHLSRLSLATGERCKTKCIQFNERWWTPSEFQMTSGRGAAKDWKRTIRHGDKCLKALLESGTLKLNLCNKNACFCDACCKGSLPSAATGLTRMVSFSDQAVKGKEIGENGRTSAKKQAKELKASRQKRLKSDSDHGDHRFEVQEFKGPGEGSSPIHLLRNDVPPSVAEVFRHPTNRINESSPGDVESFQVFQDTFYRHQIERSFLESNKISDLSSKTFVSSGDISTLGKLHSIQHHPIRSMDNNFPMPENFWKETTTSDSPKTMLRAVVEELKKKKKKLLSSGDTSTNHRVNPQDLEDSVIDLSRSTDEARFHPFSHRVASSVPPMDFEESLQLPPPSSSSSSYSPQNHYLGMNSSMFTQTFHSPHFNLPFYSPYIFMGFPIHPIISHHSRTPATSGFQLPFPSSALNFPYEFAKLRSGNPFLSSTEGLPPHTLSSCPSSQSQNFKAEDKPLNIKEESFPKSSGHDEDSKKKSFDTRCDLNVIKSEDSNDKRAAFSESLSALDFSLKACKDPNVTCSTPTGVEALDLSKKLFTD